MRRAIWALMRKEFLQVFQDASMIRLVFLAPIIQLLILGYAASTDVKLIYTAVYDNDRTEISRDYVRSFSAGGYFQPVSSKFSLLNIRDGFRENKYNVALIIPPNFSRDLALSQKTSVGFLVDGTNANSAAIAMGYAGMGTLQYNLRLNGVDQPITMRDKRLYNPEGESVYFMVPGIVAMLLTMITTMLTAMAIVREREIGTLEQLMVTPISTPALILGKILPFIIIGFVEMSLALLLGMTWFKIPFVGSWALLYFLSLIFLFTTLGMGMFISTVSSTQQQAMFFTWFFSIFSILTSGFFTPIANMPRAIQLLTYLNPLRYFVKIVRAIIMKGAGLDVLYPEAIAMVIFGLVFFSFSWLRFSKRVK